jgi:hypothetical protein
MKVTDGIVLAADSASSFFSPNAPSPVKIYNNANKIFNLVKVWPIGALMYGAGSIGSTSIETLTKDLRLRLRQPADPEYGLDPATYTVEEVARKARKYLFEEAYQTAFNGAPPPEFYLGYRVCGYSAGASLPEVWEFCIIGAHCDPPYQIQGQADFGARWAGENEALDRLLLGTSSKLTKVLIDRGMSSQDANDTYMALIAECGTSLSLPAMPIQDAIDVSRFLVETSGKFARYGLRPETIGGPTEIAAITKHEGFKWIARKHYYQPELNRETNHGR